MRMKHQLQFACMTFITELRLFMLLVSATAQHLCAMANMQQPNVQNAERLDRTIEAQRQISLHRHSSSIT